MALASVAPAAKDAMLVQQRGQEAVLFASYVINLRSNSIPP
jgi:hypothetical protein